MIDSHRHKIRIFIFQSQIQNPTGKKNAAVRPSSKVSANHTKTAKPSRTQTQNHNHDANSTAANTTTTDADDKTAHSIKTAMQQLVHLQDSRQSTHPSPFPFPCEPTP
jgi:hypothetical protein